MKTRNNIIFAWQHNNVENDLGFSKSVHTQLPWSSDIIFPI